MIPIPLAIDGANPLGFLAALGTACLLADSVPSGYVDPRVRLAWSAARNPIVTAADVNDGAMLVQRLTKLAARPAPPDGHAANEKTTRAAFEAARREERRKREEIKKRRLPRDQRHAALDAECAPLAELAASRRSEWRQARAQAAPDPAVSLGLDLTVTRAELAEHGADALDAATATSRRWVDLCAAFGAEGGGERMDATPFSLISGSGHQHFLGTAGDLMLKCTAEHLRKALLLPWLAGDDGHSFRWDPDDDRRYALLANDPTASGNKPKTLWGANRLAFEALRFFPCVRGRGGTSTVGWRNDDGSRTWRWPLWECALTPSVISSLVANGDLWRDDVESRRRLRARGVFAVYQTRRIEVGRAPNQKLNFVPAVPVWVAGAGGQDVG